MFFLFSTSSTTHYYSRGCLTSTYVTLSLLKHQHKHYLKVGGVVGEGDDAKEGVKLKTFTNVLKKQSFSSLLNFSQVTIFDIFIFIF